MSNRSNSNVIAYIIGLVIGLIIVLAIWLLHVIKRILRMIARVIGLILRSGVWVVKIIKIRLEKKRATKAYLAADNFIRVTEEEENIDFQASDVHMLLEKADNRFNFHEYKSAEKYAKQALNMALVLSQKEKLMIRVELEENQFVYEEWKRIYLLLKNEGKVNVRDIKLSFSPEVMVKDVKSLSTLNAYQDKIFDIMMKPNGSGEIPFDVKLSYTDQNGIDYTDSQRLHLNVAKA